MLKKIIFLILGIILVSCEKEEYYEFDIIDDTSITDTQSLSDNVSSTIINSGPFTIKKNTQELLFSDGFTPQDATSLSHVHGNIHYEHNGNDYLFVSSSSSYDTSNNTIYSGHPLLYKRVQEKWVLIKKFQDVTLSMVRNYDISSDGIHFVVGDAPEHPPGSSLGVGIKSNIYFGKIQEDDIVFTKVNPSYPVWAHDVSIGDINQDGILDILSTGDEFVIWYQNSDGSFTPDFDKIEYRRNWYMNLTIDLDDVNGDGSLEIITGVYNFQPETELYNNLQVYTIDPIDGIFKKTFQSTNPHEFIQGEMGAGKIRMHDMDNDGLKDAVVQREGRGIDYVSATEIWKNNGDGTFSRLDIFGSESEDTNGHYGYEVMDINNDGYNDIALIGFHWGSELRLQSPRIEFGFILNNLIWINQGDGTFQKYTQRELIGGEGVEIDIFYPIMLGDKFKYIGKKPRIGAGAKISDDRLESVIYEIDFDM